MSDDRSEDLRSRRNEAQEKVREAAQKTEKQEKHEESDSDNSSSQTIKDERREKMFYLSPEQHKEVDYVYNKLKTEYEYEYEETFLKNRHYYPLVVKHGLDDLDGLEPSEVHDLLTGLGVIDN